MDIQTWIKYSTATKLTRESSSVVLGLIIPPPFCRGRYVSRLVASVSRSAASSVLSFNGGRVWTAVFFGGPWRLLFCIRLRHFGYLSNSARKTIQFEVLPDLKKLTNLVRSSGVLHFEKWTRNTSFTVIGFN